MGHLFISYSHKDSAYVHKLAETLEKEGFEVWLDDRIHYGSEWPRVVTRNLDSSDGVIVVLSNNSYESDMVQNEVTRAREKNKPIFPLLLEGENWLIVQAKQFVDARDNSLPTEKFYKRLEEITLRKKAEREVVEKAKPVPVMPEKKEKSQRLKEAHTTRKWDSKETIIFIAFIGLVLASLFGLPPLLGQSEDTPEPTLTLKIGVIKEPSPTETMKVTEEPSSTSEPNTTPIEAFTPTSTPFPTEITDGKGVQMVLIPAGEFVMGETIENILVNCLKYSNNAICLPTTWFEDETPPHKIFLDDYYIDKFEVTNALYAICVQSGFCQPVIFTGSATRSTYYTEFDNYPVINVDWNRAKTYCEWRGGGLPTEAQWEKAARGTDRRTYPWGENLDCTRANYFSPSASPCVGDTTEVGIYKSGRSPYEVYDMTGNVSEWVADWYYANYYATFINVGVNPIGPQSGQDRVIRGGSWRWKAAGIHTYSRSQGDPSDSSNELGFRCAEDAIP